MCRMSLLLLAPLDLTLRAEARSGGHEGLPLRRCHGGVSYFEVCGEVSDEVATLGAYRVLTSRAPSWYLHGVSKSPHIPFGRGGGCGCVSCVVDSTLDLTPMSRGS